jgi:Cys-rich four helix bundle protein (predicted Tat secretion target)
MDRRELLTGVASMLAAATAINAVAADHDEINMTGSHEHHHHGSSRYQKLIEMASDCVIKAQICLNHCIIAMGQGDKDMAACAAISRQTEVMCTALQQMAISESQHLPHLAKIVMDVCKECEKECVKHDRHPECKACGESCAACAKECQAFAA